MVKRVGKILFVFLAVLGLLVAGVLLWATSESGSQKISEWLRGWVRDEMGLETSFENIDLNFFPPRIALRNITAKDTNGRVDCSVEEAELAPDVLDLIAGSPSIDEIYLGSPHCVVKLDRQAIDQLLEAAADDSGKGAEAKLDLSVLPPFEVFAVSDGKLDIEIEDPDRVGRMEASIDGLGLDVTGGSKSIEVRGMVEKAHCTWEKGDRYLDEGLESFEFRAAVFADAVEVRHLNATVAGAELRARDAYVPIPLWPKGPRVADVSVEVPLEMLARLPVDLPSMWGTAGFAGQLSAKEGSDGEPEVFARGRARLTDGKVDDIVVGNLEGLISLAPRGISFSEVALEAAEGHLFIEGNLAFDKEMSIDVTARLQRVELAHLLENLTVDSAQVTQFMSGTLTAKGTIFPLTLNVTTGLDVEDHTVLSDSFRATRKDVLLHIPRASVSGRVKIDEKQVLARGLDVRFGESQVSVDLKFNLDSKKGWSLTAKSNQFVLDNLKQIAGFDVAGRGKLNCTITDPNYGTPRISGSLHFQSMRFAGFDFDEVSSGVRFDGKSHLMFHDLAVRNTRSVYSSSEISLLFGGRNGLTIDAKVEAERVAIEDIARTFHIDTRPYGSPTGFLYGRVAIDYTLAADHLRIEARLDHDRLTVFEERFGTDGLAFVWDDGDLVVERFDMGKGGGKISITGAMGSDGSLNFMGVAREVDLSSVDNERFKALDILGRSQIFVIVDGTTAHPTGRADVRISEARHNDLLYGPSHLELELENNIVTGRGNLAGDMAALEHGRLDLSDNTFGLEGFVYDVDLISILDIDVQGQRASLDVTGEVALEGKLEARPHLTGYASLNRVSFAVNDFEFTNKNQVEISARRDRFTLARTRFKGNDVTFDVSGKAGLENITNISLEGLVNLSSIRDLVGPVTSSSGKLMFNARVKGTWSEPQFRGEATVENGAFQISGFPAPLENVFGRIVLGSNKISFMDFKASCAGGDLDMDGQLTLGGLDVLDYRINMNMRDLELQLSEDLFFKASTTRQGLLLRPGGKRDLPTITGDVEITNLRYTEDLKMIELSDLLSVDRLTGTRLRTKKPRVFDEKKDKIAFDIRLHGSRNLEVRNNIVDARLRIDDVEEPLRLVGTNQSYGFLGRLLGTRGQIRFAGKTFDIRYAALSFRDALRPDNPTFRVTADGQVRDWKITITAQGTVDDYEIKITSQPYLSQQDLVFLLLTGMTKAEHLQFGSSGLARIGTSILGPVGGDMIPLEVQIYTEYSEKAGTDTTRISLGKWITENIWAAFSSSLGEERDIEANIDYRINDNLSISVDYDNESQTGNLGIDLKYRKEF